MSYSINDRNDFIREEAQKLGFDSVGFSRAERLDQDGERLSNWLQNANHGEMSYLANHFDKRTDPSLLVPGAKTVISLTYNYFTGIKQTDPQAPIISAYAFGRDYHKVLKKKLKSLFKLAQEQLGVHEGRYFVDSAPVLEKAWAAKAGLGWIGKNTMLIHPKKGSYFFLAELILDIEFEYDIPIADHCGTCRKCIEACPTDAIDIEGYSLMANLCISYATIEKKGAIPADFMGKMENRVFGCDICLAICPWNKFAQEHNEDEFNPKEKMLSLSLDKWKKMDEFLFEELFNGTPVRRTKYEGLKRNISFIKEEGL